MAIDPICGMTVDETKALKLERRGDSHYFCSEHCLTTFVTQPATENPPEPDSGGEHACGRHNGPAAETPAPTQASHSCCSGKHGHGHAAHNHDHGGAKIRPSAHAAYYCPMCPGVESDAPGDCPKCGMALERNPLAKPKVKTVWTCPMHPEVELDHPGECPKCGMDLEPRSGGEAANEEEAAIRALSRKFWIALALTIPVFFLGMGKMIPGLRFVEWMPHRLGGWFELAFSAPVVLWAGASFFLRGWNSIVNRSPNMFTLIAIGVVAAFGFSVAAVLAPGAFPESFRQHGEVDLYFEAAAAIITLVLLGQLLEARARGRTGKAVQALIELGAKTAHRVRAGGGDRLDRHVHCLGAVGTRTGAGLRSGQCRRGPDRRMSLRARPGHADVHHGGRGPRCPGRHPG